jgi:hypothetical protein
MSTLLKLQNIHSQTMTLNIQNQDKKNDIFTYKIIRLEIEALKNAQNDLLREIYLENKAPKFLKKYRSHLSKLVKDKNPLTIEYEDTVKFLSYYKKLLKMEFKDIREDVLTYGTSFDLPIYILYLINKFPNKVYNYYKISNELIDKRLFFNSFTFTYGCSQYQNNLFPDNKFLELMNVIKEKDRFMIYPKQINDIIKNNDKNFIVFNLSIFYKNKCDTYKSYDNKNYEGHANMLIYNKKENIVKRIEPSCIPDDKDFYEQEILDKMLINIFKNIKYQDPELSCPRTATKKYSFSMMPRAHNINALFFNVLKNSLPLEKKMNFEGSWGFCMAWSLYYTEKILEGEDACALNEKILNKIFDIKNNKEERKKIETQYKEFFDTIDNTDDKNILLISIYSIKLIKEYSSQLTKFKARLFPTGVRNYNYLNIWLSIII